MKTPIHPCHPVRGSIRKGAWWLVLVAGLLGSGTAALANPVIVPPDQAVAGKSYAEWTVSFEQWGLAIPWDAHHPWRDKTGANAFRGQSGPLWFLGGGVATRQVVVPNDRWLYVSIGGMGCSTLEPDPFHGENAEGLRACVERFHIQELACEVDGEPVPDLERHQVITPMFPIELPPLNVAGVQGGGSGQSVATGVAIILGPLPPGSLLRRIRRGVSGSRRKTDRRRPARTMKPSAARWTSLRAPWSSGSRSR